jgi:fructuronate reductase
VTRPLSRTAGDGRAAAPVRILHLGLGSFFRAHQAWYTDRAADADAWGIAAFSGRRAEPARALTAQDGLYTLVTRGPDADRHEVVGSLSAAHPGGDHTAWLRYWRQPELAVVTLTVTEAGYTARPEDAAADLAALRADPEAPVTTVAARLLAGLGARRRAGGGPVAIVPCDNLPGNGAVVRRTVRELADAVGRPALLAAAESASYVSTVVDRITPAATPADVAATARATGRGDAVPVVTEPSAEWVLCGDFPAGRPRWQDAGARFVPDAAPYAQRKLWLLNGGHSLLAYAGPLLGHTTVAEVVADPRCRDWLAQWWDEASGWLSLDQRELADYRQALLERFANPRLRHTLAQIAADGSQKLPVRILPVLSAERARGAVPQGAARVLAAWLLHLRGSRTGAPASVRVQVPVQDPAAAALTAAASGPLPGATRRVLGLLHPPLAADPVLTAAVTALAKELDAS